MIVTRTGSIGIAARREAVWAALHDGRRVALCIPGCRRVVARDGNSFAVEAAVRFGPVRVAFDGMVEVSDGEEPAVLSLTGRGGGGFVGAASGTVSIHLFERREGCRLDYDLRAEADGPITRLGSTFVAGLAAVLAERFASRFTALFEDEAAAPRRRRLGRKPAAFPS